MRTKSDLRRLADLLEDFRVALNLENFAAAERTLELIEASYPNNSETRFARIQLLDAIGKPEEGLALLDHLIEQGDPKEFAYLRSRLLYKTKSIDAAIEQLERNLDRRDYCRKSLDLWLHILNESRRLDYARERLAQLVIDYPDAIEFNFGLGTVAENLGDLIVARTAYETARRLAPDNVYVTNALAKLELVTGRIQHAIELAQSSVDSSPFNPDALRIISLEHHFCYGDPQFTQLNRASAAMTSYSFRDQIQLHYALGKAYLDAHENDTAFSHYEVAGDKHASVRPFNQNETDRIYKNLIRCVTRSNLEMVDETGCDSNLPVFILGMPRSGTTLLEQILSSHSSIYGAGELLQLGRVVDGMRCGNFTLAIGQPEPIFSKDSHATWSERGAAYVDYLRGTAPGSPLRVIDKMPANYHYVGMIHAILPKAPIIHMMRHPMEVCFSCYKTLFTVGHDWSFRLDDLAFQYRKYWEIMAHWRVEFPELLFDVYYENLIAEPEGEVRRVLDRLDLDWDSRCLDFHSMDRPVKTASVAQVRKPIYQTSANRWKRYEKYLSPLAEQLSDIIRQYEFMLQNSRNNV